MTKLKKLAILWTSADPQVAIDMLLMYTLKSNTNRWWDTCHLISWGPSNRLLAENSEVQKEVKKIIEAGVRVWACRRCAESLGVAEKLEELGVDVRLMGEPLTDYLQDPEYRVLCL